MTQRTPTTQRSRLALVAIVAGLAAAGWYGSRLVRRPAKFADIRNVLLVSIDTCRADHLSCYGAKRPITPRIDALAREGILFEEALSPIPLTTPAHSSLLTGTYPPTHGVRLNNGHALAASSITLAERLHDAGYKTGAFVGGFPLDPGFGLSQGFDTYDAHFTKASETSSSVAERTADEVAAPAIAWLDRNAAGPFFLFVHFFDAHLPYEPPPPFASTYADDPYAGELAYVDAALGKILDRLHALSLDGDTLVVVTADHGEGLNEHGEKSHGYFIYQSTQHVPLVMRIPGGPKGRRVAERAGLVDVMPTILDLAGVKPSRPLQGASLRAAIAGERAADRPRGIYCESLVATQFGCASLSGLVEGGWKYILAPRPELYDLANDPGEGHNVVDAQPAIALRMRERLQTMRQELEAGASEGGEAAPDPDAVARLQSLGYVGGGSAPKGPLPDAGRPDPKDFIAGYERLEKANALMHSNRGTDAERELAELLLGHPDLVAAEDLLAQIARNGRRPADAVAHRERIVAILEASQAREELPAAYFNLAFALRETGNDDGAIANYRRAIALQPDYADAHNSLGLALARSGKLAEAIDHFEQALKSNPDHAQAQNNLGAALEQRGNAAAAVEHYARAIAIKPDYSGALSRLAWIRATGADFALRNGAEAITLAERAVAITGRTVVLPLDALAAAYAESGRFDEAVATAGEAAAAARAAGDARSASQIESRIVLYRQRRPYRVVSR